MVTMKTASAAHSPAPEPAGGGTAELAIAIPRGHVGPYFMSGLGRMIWWTGRVAIGLRYEPMGDRGSPEARSAK